MKRFQEAIDDLERRKPGEFTFEEKRQWAGNRSVMLDEGEVVARRVHCPWCKGDGGTRWEPDYEWDECPFCNGTGRVLVEVGS